MDFEEFRRKRKEQAEAQAQAERQAQQPAANGEKLEWVDGMGPVGPRNPKVKGFILGRFRRKRIDPSQLQRPKGYESTALGSPEREGADQEIERRRAALERAEAELRASEEKRKLEEIERRRAAEGIQRPKGIRRF